MAAAPASGRRLAVMFLVLTGFLTMHGFLATSGSEIVNPDGPGHLMSVALVDGRTGGAGVGGEGAGVDRWTAVEALDPAPGGGQEHGPQHHSEVLAGCVLALVGVVGLALAGAALRRRGVSGAGGSFRRAELPPSPLLGSSTPAPVPYGLCVMRV